MAATEVSKLVAAGYNEGNLKWATISRNQRLLGTTFNQMPNSLMNTTCSLLPVALFLDDHKAETLQAVVDAAQVFAAKISRKAFTLHWPRAMPASRPLPTRKSPSPRRA